MIQIETVTDEEQKAIDELRRRTQHELSPRLLNDETLYYRFLKARDFNLKHAEEMLRNHISDCKYYDIEYIVNEYTTPKLLEKYAPTSLLGFDKTGSTVRYYDFGGLDVKGYLSVFSFYELMVHAGKYLQDDIDLMTEQTKQGRPAYQMVLIVNLDKLNLFRATYKKGLDSMYATCKLLQDDYPERIKAVYIINASFYFTLAFPVIKSVFSAGLMEKLHVYGSSGWKEVLLKIIDADTLPAFLGGERTDPDGNPNCNSFVMHCGPIPQELYKKKEKTLKGGKEVKKLIVPRFTTSEIPVYIIEKDSNIEWEFETKNRDIAFSLCYKDNCGDNPKVEELIPKHRVDTLLESETGIYKCSKVGTYIITFDNSYSWIFSKEIYYRIRIVKPSDIHHLTS